MSTASDALAGQGQTGDAVSLVCVDELKLLTDIERLIKRDLSNKIIAGFEPDPRIKAEPIVNGAAADSAVAARTSRTQPKEGRTARYKATIRQNIYGTRCRSHACIAAFGRARPLIWLIPFQGVQALLDNLGKLAT